MTQASRTIGPVRDLGLGLQALSQHSVSRAGGPATINLVQPTPRQLRRKAATVSEADGNNNQASQTNANSTTQTGRTPTPKTLPGVASGLDTAFGILDDVNNTLGALDQRVGELRQQAQQVFSRPTPTTTTAAPAQNQWLIFAGIGAVIWALTRK